MACGSAALYLVCVATLFAASQSLYLASDAWNCDNTGVAPSSPTHPDVSPFLRELMAQPTPDLQNLSFSLASVGGYEMILRGERDKTNWSETDTGSWPGIGFGCGSVFRGEDVSRYYASSYISARYKSGNCNHGHTHHPTTHTDTKGGQNLIHGTVCKMCERKAAENKSTCGEVQNMRRKMKTKTEIELCTTCQWGNLSSLNCPIEKELEFKQSHAATPSVANNMTPVLVGDATWSFAKTFYNIPMSLLA